MFSERESVSGFGVQSGQYYVQYHYAPVEILLYYYCFFFLLKESGFFFFDCTSLDPNTSLRSGACSAAFRWMQEIPESIRSYDSLPGRGSLSTRPCVYPVPVSPLRGCKLMPPSIPPNCKATVQGVKTRTGSRMCSNPTQSRHPMKRTPWPA